jgi:hypothetical protein
MAVCEVLARGFDRERRDLPIEQNPPSLPMLRMLLLLPMLRIDAKLPTLSSDAALATDSTLEVLTPHLAWDWDDSCIDVRAPCRKEN